MNDTENDSKEVWHAHFIVHGDPLVVTDRKRPHFTRICDVDTSPDDYVHANCHKIAATNDLYTALLEVVEPLLVHQFKQSNMSAESWQWFCRAQAALAKYRGEGHQFIPD